MGRIDRSNKSFCGTCTKTEYVTRDGSRKLEEKLDHEWKTIGDNSFVHTRFYSDEKGPPIREIASGANSYYLFRATKKNSKADWLLDEVELGPPSGEGAAIGNPKLFPRTMYRIGLNNLLFTNEYLDQIVADKKYQFQITGNCTTRPDNPNLVVIPCRYRLPTKKGQSFVNYTEGKITLDSSRYWIVMEYDVSLSTFVLSPQGIEGPIEPSSARQTVSFEYLDVDGTPALVSRAEKHIYNEPGQQPAIFERNSQFQLQKAGPLDESEFRMSRFGLPEPIGVTPPKKNNIYIWFIAGGLGFFAIAAMAVRQKRRLENRGRQNLP